MRTIFLGVSLLAIPALGGGTLQGSVAFVGPAPAAKKVDRSVDPACNPAEGVEESLTLSKDGKAVKNVLVRLIDAPAATTPPDSPAVIDQVGCSYTPRVVGLVRGQKLQVKNSDGTVHNVHGYAGKKTIFNRAQPPGAPPLLKPAPPDAEVVSIKCDMHPWMASFAVVVANPHFAVTDESGAFEIKDIPAGTYTLESWHETLAPQRATVTVKEGEAAKVKLELRP